jgi:trans-aconitate 2-methyltransferase
MLHLNKMSLWNPKQYLHFADERTQPCRDLVSRISLEHVRSVIDIGCGPGNSTHVLASRWPDAEIIGLDSSPEMLDAARKAYPDRCWIDRETHEWAAAESDSFDIVFSNAALQWVPDHAVIYPKLLGRTTPSGALAVQVPANFNAPPHELMRHMADSTQWRHRFAGGGVREWHSHDPMFYYDLLAPRCRHVEMWEIEYFHVLADANAVVEWYRGTGLRPFLDALDNDALRQQFVAEYYEGISRLFPARSDNRVLLPFRRSFLIAYR